jgi:ankyrin repeat protein
MHRPAIVLAIALGVVGQAVAADLHTAAGAGDLATVERLLADGAAVDTPGPNAETPLTAAALAGSAEVAEMLLARGADVQARNAGGFTPLHAAAYSGSLPVAVLLLDRGARLEDANNKAGVTPLLVAAEQNHPRVVELFIARGAAVGTPERDGYMPLTRALWKGNDEVMRVLKRHGATCQPADIVGGEALYQQCLAAGS